jgi:hypothetical protein
VRTNAPHSPWDSRDKPGQDAEEFYSLQILSRIGTFLFNRTAVGQARP